MYKTSVQKEIFNSKNIGGFEMKQFIKNLLNKRLNNEKGLTLIELLAVIVILAIVAAIAIPAIGNIISDSRIKGMKADIANVINAANLYKVGNEKYPDGFTVGQLKTEGFLESSGTVDDSTVISEDAATNSIPDGTTILNGSADNGTDYTLTNVYLDILDTDSAELTGTGISVTP